ncbi:lysylphosphatidylglycerol synthase domain-containing protein [Olivibacter sitiensis]|uniref:lysylphosphatidylglycerol synthase domain-containing protein n=1 Tax=Olivibacter sitiensis TaxID=376470 RepID=UPI0004121CBF|nr:lysylphosphatidylglycerol synthase domain-containing protein [Olivibacter sitiensis]
MKYIKVLLVLAVACCLFFFIRATDFRQTWEVLRNVGARFIWVMVSTAVAYFLGTLGWYYCFTEKGRSSLNLFRLFMVRQIGETVGQLNPTGVLAGEWSKVQLLKARGIDQQELHNSVYLSRIIMIFSQLSLLLLAMVWLVFFSAMQLTLIARLTLLLIPLFILLIIISLVFCDSKNTPFNKPPVKTEGLLGKLLAELRKVREAIYHYRTRHLRSFLCSTCFFSLHWLVGSLELVLLLYFLDQPILLIQGLLMDMGIVFVKSTASFIPGQLGIEELGNKMALDLVGINSAAIWLAVSILRRARQLCWMGIVALFYAVLHMSKNTYPSIKNGNSIC